MAGNKKTSDTDPGFAKLLARVNSLKGAGIKAGILAKDGDKTYPDDAGVTVAQVALWNEFGVDSGPIHIPERPAFRTSADIIMREVQPKMDLIAQRVLDGKLAIEASLDYLGMKSVSIIKKTIVDWTSPPNTQRTIEKKARKHGLAQIKAGTLTLADFDNPLIDTGQMLNSVTYEKVKPNAK